MTENPSARDIDAASLRYIAEDNHTSADGARENHV